MANKQLVLVKPGFMKPEDRKRVERNGMLVVETEDFAAFKVVDSDFLITSNDFAIAALEVLAEKASWSSEEKFAKKILAAMKARKES